VAWVATRRQCVRVDYLHFLHAKKEAMRALPFASFAKAAARDCIRVFWAFSALDNVSTCIQGAGQWRPLAPELLSTCKSGCLVERTTHSVSMRCPSPEMCGACPLVWLRVSHLDTCVDVCLLVKVCLLIITDTAHLRFLAQVLLLIHCNVTRCVILDVLHRTSTCT
jgi:hypothetical protein